MNKQQLRQLRQGINFDMGSMAACVGVPKSTYQKYEDGTAAVPAQVERAVRELVLINVRFMSRYQPGGEFDRELDCTYPHGIPSCA